MNRKDFFKSLSLGVSVIAVAPAILLEASRINLNTSAILVKPKTGEFGDNKYVFDVWREDDYYVCRAVFDNRLKYGHILNMRFYNTDLDRHILSMNFPTIGKYYSLDEFFDDEIKRILKDESI